MTSILRALSIWYQMPPGSLLLEAECEALDEWLASCAGDYIVQIGGPPSLSHLRASPILHQAHFDTAISDHLLSPQVVVDFSHLPLLPHSVDVCVVVHVLESLDDPHAFLKTIYDSLSPGGYVVILGFNPLSFWGLKRLLKSKRGFPWSLNFQSSWKVRRMLRAQRFTIDSQSSCFFRPPAEKRQRLERWALLEKVVAYLFPKYGATTITLAQKTSQAVLPPRKLSFSKGQKQKPFKPAIEPTAMKIKKKSML